MPLNPRVDSRDWLKPSIILAILGLMACNPAFQLNWVSNANASDSLFPAQDDVSYEVTGRYAGSPSIVLPFGDYLIVAIADKLELRNSTYGLISSVQMPYFIKDAVLTDGGDVIVPIPNHGLFLVEIDEEMNLNILDHYESGTWTDLECGYDFFLASRPDSDDICLFDISTDEIVLERIVNEGFEEPRWSPSAYDANGHLYVWTHEHDFRLWNHSQGVERVFLDTHTDGPDYVSLEGGMLTWWGHDWEMITTVFADIADIWGTNEIEVLQKFGGRVSPIASTSEFIYMFARSSYSSHARYFLAINLTPPYSNYMLDNTHFWNNFLLTKCAANEYGIVLTGLNYIEWWMFFGNELELKLTNEYPGYITDLTSAFGVADSVVSAVYGIDLQNSDRTWGYPFVDPDLFPIVGDMTDIIAARNHLYYQDQSTIRSLVNPRMKHQPLVMPPWYYEPHPTAELHEFNGTLYRLNCSWDENYRLYAFDSTKHYDSKSEVLGAEFLHHLGESYPYYYMRTMQDDIYIAGGPSHLFAMNVTSLEYGISQASLPVDSMMLQIYKDKLLVLSNVITCYEKNGSWPLSPSLIYLSEIDIDADVFTIADGMVYAANSTHIHMISLETDGTMNIVESIEVPTNIHQRTFWSWDPWFIVFLEVGDLLVDPVSGTIYRAAGTYGVWVIERTVHTEPPTTTTTTTTSTTTTTIEPMDFLEAVVRFSAGFGISLVSILAVAALLKRKLV